MKLKNILLALALICMCSFVLVGCGDPVAETSSELAYAFTSDDDGLYEPKYPFATEENDRADLVKIGTDTYYITIKLFDDNTYKYYSMKQTDGTTAGYLEEGTYVTNKYLEGSLKGQWYSFTFQSKVAVNNSAKPNEWTLEIPEDATQLCQIVKNSRSIASYAVDGATVDMPINLAILASKTTQDSDTPIVKSSNSATKALYTGILGVGPNLAIINVTIYEDNTYFYDLYMITMEGPETYIEEGTAVLSGTEYAMTSKVTNVLKDPLEKTWKLQIGSNVAEIPGGSRNLASSDSGAPVPAFKIPLVLFYSK